MKYFFDGNSEYCYPKQYHLDYMKENNIKGICENYGYVYENTEKSITLKLK